MIDRLLFLHVTELNMTGLDRIITEYYENCGSIVANEDLCWTWRWSGMGTNICPRATL